MPTIRPGLDYSVDIAGNFTFTESAGKLSHIQISYLDKTSDTWQSALGELGLSLATGNIGQPVWSWLQSTNPTQAVHYSGIAYVYADAYPLTNQAEVENHSFEVVTGHSALPTGGDCWPDVVLRDFLVTHTSSVGWSAARLAGLGQFNNYVRARQLWLSVQMAQQKPARDWLLGLAEICNSQWVWQGGVLDLVPRGDEVITGEYGTYTPNTTPVFDLVHGEGGDLLEAVEIEPVVNEDAHNVVLIEWTNRNNNYAVEVMTASDQAHIELFGQRPASVVAMHAIHDPAVATGVAQQMLQREMTVWNKYRFKVPFSRALIGLMDLVTLTDADSNLLRVPVRIISRSESGSMEYAYEAEDAPIGSASGPLYGTQASAGFAHDYNVAPGSVIAPVIFEAPTDLTLNGLEVYSAVTGPANANWGGCRVYVSLDGLTYQDRGRIYGGARYGQLTVAMGTTGSASVLLAGLGGKLLGGSAADAQSLSTLCWADGIDGGEYFAYQTATLTAANAYTLTGLVRAAYQNTLQAHATAAKFVRVDGQIGKSGPLSDALIGNPIYFKFCSFNIYGGGEQSLVDVTAYSYTIGGKQLLLPPPDVTGFAVVLQADGYRATWSALANPADYKFTKIKSGTAWATSTEAGPGGAAINDATTSFALGWLAAGTSNYLAKHADRFGAESNAAAPASILVLAPKAVVFKDVRVEQNKVNFEWADAKTSQPILNYNYRVAKVVGGIAGTYISRGGSGSDSRSDNIPFFEAATWRIEITATDVAGNIGPANTTDVLISLPDDYAPLLNSTSTGAGAMVNAAKTGQFNRVTLLLNNTETWQQHFASRGWNTIQDQINAGFARYFQPGTTTASYTEDIDAGVVFTAGTIAVNLSINTLVGAPVSSIQIGYKRLIGDAYTFAAAGARNVIAQNFRYIRIIVSATGTGADLAEIELLQTSINVQKISENATVACLSTDVNGTPYTTTRGFADVEGVIHGAIVQGSGITRVEARIVDAGAPGTPAQVFIYLFNSSSQRVSGNQYITINGL
jgi:Putative phage tail protein